MRAIGNITLALGVLVGIAGGMGLMLGLHTTGLLPWLVTIGLAKLTLVASGGLLFAGATAQRLARRGEMRKLVEGPTPK